MKALLAELLTAVEEWRYHNGGTTELLTQM